MLKALPFIKAFAQFVAAMDKTEVGHATVGADKLFAALEEGCASSLCELLLHVPFLFLVQLNPMLKALPFIKAFAQFVAAMDKTEVGHATVGADKLFAALEEGCASSLTDGCGMQVDPKELCALRRQTNIAEADNLFPINGHIKEDLLGCNQWRQGIEAIGGIVGAHELLDKGRVKDRCIGELPSRLGDRKDGVTIG